MSTFNPFQWIVISSDLDRRVQSEKLTDLGQQDLLQVVRLTNTATVPELEAAKLTRREIQDKVLDRLTLFKQSPKFPELLQAALKDVAQRTTYSTSKLLGFLPLTFNTMPPRTGEVVECITVSHPRFYQPGEDNENGLLRYILGCKTIDVGIDPVRFSGQLAHLVDCSILDIPVSLYPCVLSGFTILEPVRNFKQRGFFYYLRKETPLPDLISAYPSVYGYSMKELLDFANQYYSSNFSTEEAEYLYDYFTSYHSKSQEAMNKPNIDYYSKEVVELYKGLGSTRDVFVSRLTQLKRTFFLRGTLRSVDFYKRVIKDLPIYYVVVNVE